MVTLPSKRQLIAATARQTIDEAAASARGDFRKKQLMRMTKHAPALIALSFAFVLANVVATSAQDNNSNLRQVASGQKMKVQGIVIKRDSDFFRVQDIKTITTDVVLTPSTADNATPNGRAKNRRVEIRYS
ncbi:MAG: hypothetical protein AABN95_24785 [Acidobacteriota bacterium]